MGFLQKSILCTANPNTFMIRLKKSINILLLLSCIAVHGFSQNLYDLDHSKQYAGFLSQSQQYKLAAMEFERLLFMEPESNEFRLRLIQAYRYSEQLPLGINRIKGWYPNLITDTTLFQEYIKLNLLNGSYTDVLYSLDKHSILPAGETRYYQLSGIVLQKNWPGAKKFIDTNPKQQWPGFTELCNLVQQHEQIKFKKPGVALTLSAFVPGLGKIYSNDWKDGLISFLFVATNAFQAYRGFSKDGVSSVYGWIFSSLSFGFYTGNLYGSWKSAKDFNFRSEEALYHEIQHTIYDRF